MGDLNVRTHNLSRPKEPRKRKDLQFALHALALNLRCTLSVQQACCTKCDPLRDEIREVGIRQEPLARRHTDGPLWAALL